MHIPTFLVFTAAALLFACESVALTPQELKDQRLEKAWQKRRILFNDDGNELFSANFVRLNQVSKDAYLSRRAKPLVGTQVDSIFFCTNAAVGLFFLPVKGGSLYKVNHLGIPTLVAPYADAGLDILQMMVEFSHEQGKEIFWSFRMNDTHDGDFESYTSALFDQNAFKSAHPEFLLGDKGSSNKVWSGVNYALPEVQDYILGIFADITARYDIDGIELDFFRHLAFFKSTANGKPTTPEENAAMTGFVRKVRALTEEAGLRRGRPILLAVKTPDSLEYCRAVGLDLELWLQEGLVDLYIPGGYFQLNLWEDSVASAPLQSPCVCLTR